MSMSSSFTCSTASPAAIWLRALRPASGSLETTRIPVELLPERPNLFRLYEANVGTITPMLAEELKDAEASFPHAWLEEAIQLAVEHNVRNWRYIRAILERWVRKERTVPDRLPKRTDDASSAGAIAEFIES